MFVGEKYDARKELNDWSTVSYDDSSWQKVIPVDYPMNNLIGQSSEPVKIVETFKPKKIIHSPAGETIIDVGRIIAGFVEFSLVAPAGIEIKLEHSEVLDTQGNYYNNILGINKEQMKNKWMFILPKRVIKRIGHILLIMVFAILESLIGQEKYLLIILKCMY